MRMNKDEEVIQRPVLGSIAQVSDTIQFKHVQVGVGISTSSCFPNRELSHVNRAHLIGNRIIGSRFKFLSLPFTSDTSLLPSPHGLTCYA